MVAISSLSVAANELRTLLKNEITGLEIDQIKIGHPKYTFENMGDAADKNFLNLFFYHVSYDGFPADGLSENPFYVRLYCLITAVGGKESSPSPGENDLRLIGEVMRILHEQPEIRVKDEDNQEVAQLQVVPHELNLDNLNHIWSTQGDTAYRLSVAYEMALAPIPLAESVERSPRAGEIGTEVRGDMDREPLPSGGFNIETSAPLVPKVTVDIKKPEWSPHVCLADPATKNLAYTLLMKKSELPLVGFLKLNVLVAGKPSESVHLVWDAWIPAKKGWERSGSPQHLAIQTVVIDPENVDMALTVVSDLPINTTGQAALYAEREFKRPDGSTITLRSNPLLITIYEEGA